MVLTFGSKGITSENKVNVVWKVVLTVWYEEVIMKCILDEGAIEY